MSCLASAHVWSCVDIGEQTSGPINVAAVWWHRSRACHLSKSAPREIAFLSAWLIEVFVQLMELMQGTCTLSSTLGVGTTNTIQVRLPKAPAHIASPTLSSQIWNGGRAPTQTSRNPREYKILLAEGELWTGLTRGRRSHSRLLRRQRPSTRSHDASAAKARGE